MRNLLALLFLTGLASAQTVQVPITVTVTPPTATAAGNVTIAVSGSTTNIPIPLPVIVTPPPPPPPPPPVTGNGGLTLGGTAIFIDPMNVAGSSGTRSGPLDSRVWGNSKLMGGSGLNFGQQAYNTWASTSLVGCNGTSTVLTPNDIVICPDGMHEATNDNIDGGFEDGDVTVNAFYPKQPFDFAGRVGTIAFDVSNDTNGNHSAWPEVWMSDLPVPAPFEHFESWADVPANGFGIRLSGNADPGQFGICPNRNNINSLRWTVDSAVVSSNYNYGDSLGYGSLAKPNVTPIDCVIMSSGNMNHVEIRVSQSEIDVYAADAGNPSSLRLISKITNINLSFTRGLVWLEDVHYNADKGDSARASQRQHTFSWANLAFDGPFTQRDFTFDAPDNTAPGINGSVNLGKFSQANEASTWTISAVPAKPQVGAVKVLFNFNAENRPNPTKLNVTVNGNLHVVPWPYPDQTIYTWRTLAVGIPVTDLVAGTNTVTLGSDVAIVFANVNIVLAAVSGGVPVLPGSNQNYP